jgi:hypothetical protein
MKAFISRLGNPARSRAALHDFAARDTDIRPMRWTHFERVDLTCRHATDDGLDCYELRVIHETTVSGYTSWSRYDVCWRGDRIQRVSKLEGGDGSDRL